MGAGVDASLYEPFRSHVQAFRARPQGFHHAFRPPLAAAHPGTQLLSRDAVLLFSPQHRPNAVP